MLHARRNAFLTAMLLAASVASGQADRRSGLVLRAETTEPPAAIASVPPGVTSEKNAVSPAPVSAEALLRTIADESASWEVRRDAAMALARRPDFRMDLANGLLKSKNYENRLLGVLALEGGGREAVPVLLDLMATDEHGFVRAFCATVLGSIGDGRALTPLLEMAAKEPSVRSGWRAREHAVEALGQFRDPRATQILAAIVDEDLAQKRYYGLARRALKPLAMIGDAPAVRALARAAIHDRSQGLCQQAESRVAELRNPAGLTEIAKLAAGQPEAVLTLRAIQALGSFHTDEAADALAHALTVQGTASRWSSDILESLSKTGRRKAYERLLTVLCDDSLDRERWHAASALSRGDSSAVTEVLIAKWPALRDSVSRKDPKLVMPALLAHAMAGLSDQRLLPLWQDIFERIAPAARKGRWGGHVAEPFEAPMYGFFRGLQNIGRPALPYLTQIREDAANKSFQRELDRIIAAIEHSHGAGTQQTPGDRRGGRRTQ